MTQALVSDESLSKAAETTGAPLPGEFAPNALKFEQWMAGGLAPIAGLNLCLLGCLSLGKLTDSVKYAGVTSLILGVVAIGAVLRRARARSYSDYFSVGLAAWVLACALLLPGLTGLVALLVVTFLFAMVLTKRVHGRAFVLLSVWLPFLLEQAHTPFATVISTFVLGSSAILLLHRRFLGAAFVVIAVLLAQVSFELSRQDYGRFSLMLLAAATLTLAVLYEVAVPVREFSTFRLFIGQSPVIAALVVATWATLPPNLPIRGFIWAFAGATAAYQLLRVYLERAAVPTRLAWVGLAVALAASAELEQVSIYGIVCQIAAVAGALHLTAVVLGASVLADAGVLLLACDLAALYFAGYWSKRSPSLSLVVASAVAGIALVLASKRFPAKPSLPWWSGFLRKQHAALLSDILTKVTKRASDLAVVKIFFGWLSLTDCLAPIRMASGGNQRHPAIRQPDRARLAHPFHRPESRRLDSAGPTQPRTQL